MEREVTIMTPGGQIEKLSTDAVNYGQLKEVVHSSTDIRLDDMKATVRETKNTLEQANAILPEEDFTIFLSPAKIKSGN